MGCILGLLFNYDERFIRQQGNAIELGRSVIAAEYQKSLSALLMLWKGIATFVCSPPSSTLTYLGLLASAMITAQKPGILFAESMAVHHYDMPKCRVSFAE